MIKNENNDFKAKIARSQVMCLRDKAKLVLLASFVAFFTLVLISLLISIVTFVLIATRSLNRLVDSLLLGSVKVWNKKAFQSLAQAANKLTETFLNDYSINISIMFVTLMMVLIAIFIVGVFAFRSLFNSNYTSALLDKIVQLKSRNQADEFTIQMLFTAKGIFLITQAIKFSDTINNPEKPPEVTDLVYELLGKEHDYASRIKSRILLKWVVIASVMFTCAAISIVFFVCSVRLIPKAVVLIGEFATLISSDPSYVYIFSKALQRVGVDIGVANFIEAGYFVSGVLMVVFFVIGLVALVYGASYKLYEPIALDPSLVSFSALLAEGGELITRQATPLEEVSLRDYLSSDYKGLGRTKDVVDDHSIHGAGISYPYVYSSIETDDDIHRLTIDAVLTYKYNKGDCPGLRSL